MKRMRLALPTSLWTLIIISGCVGSQVANEVQLGRNALQTRQPQVALGYLRHAAELDPNYRTPYSIRESVWTYLGRAYYEVGNFPEARRALERALSNDKDDPLARLYFGLTLLHSGDQQGGRRETENGLREINNLLNRLASSPSNGIYWDPTRQIRSDIQRALASSTLESSELIILAQRVGSQLDEEIDNVRRDEARDKYNRGGDM
ncbi:MAG TPA: tetratricopeptide repeat protein [Candidatus Binatia bacterium]|nr:tetratricopeptide repeat protein [Candidatus Binatia bacterium]